MTTYTVSWRDRDDTGHKITVHSIRAAQLLLTNVQRTGFYDIRLTRNQRTFNTIVIALDGQPRKV
jgi:hypothetical protein